MQFERLQQQNSTLTLENLALRSAKKSRLSSPTNLEQGWRSGKSVADNQPVSSLGVGAFSEPTASVKSIAETPPNKFHEPSPSMKVEGVPSSRPSWALQNTASRDSRRSTSSKTSETGLLNEVMTQFEHLDVHGLGKIYLKDIHQSMEAAGMQVEVIGLVKMHHLFMGEPETRILHRGKEPQEKDLEGLSIDFGGYMHIMQDNFCRDGLDDATLACIENLKNLRAGKDMRRPPSHSSSGSSLGSELPAYKQMGVWLETIPSIVIVLNMIVAGLSTDLTDLNNIWEVVEYIFAVFYTIECIVKLWVFGFRGFFCGALRAWNIFDLCCVSVSLAESITSVMMRIYDREDSDILEKIVMVKVLRLARLARFVRLLRFKAFNHLKLMVLGVFSGLQVLSWAIVLLIVLIYLLGIAMTNLFKDQYQEYSNVPSSMFTLFRCWTDGCAAYDGTPLPEIVRKDYGFSFMAFHILTTMIITVGVFNLIMAIFIDNVVTNQLVRKHKELEERSMEIETRFKRCIINMFNKGHSDTTRMTKRNVAKEIEGINSEWAVLLERNVEVTREMFVGWLEDHNFLQLLDEAEIETANKSDLFEVLDSDMGGQLSMRELTTGLMKLRGPVTKADIVAVRLKVRHLTTILENALSSLSKSDPTPPRSSPPSKAKQKPWGAAASSSCIFGRAYSDLEPSLTSVLRAGLSREFSRELTQPLSRDMSREWTAPRSQPIAEDPEATGTGAADLDPGASGPGEVALETAEPRPVPLRRECL